MGKYRKLPFGYTMQSGCVVCHPEEHQWVSYIFSQYAAGISFKELAEYLDQKGIPFDGDKPWNKNMVARIIGDTRYYGSGEYPAIIEETMFLKAKALRTRKNPTPQKTEAQKTLRRKCKFPLTRHIEQEVLYLLNSLIQNPEQIETPKDVKVTADRLDGLKTELEAMFAQFPVDENRTRDKLMQIAVAMYEVIDPREYETYRMREVFRREQPRTELDALLIAMNISAVLVDSNGNVRIQLKNEQGLGKEETN